MNKIHGVNLGNWLVLEKWMTPQMFEGTGAEDEIWLNRKLEPQVIREKLRKHRDTYITKEDFSFLKGQGINMVRIPVPYFLLGDRAPYVGGIEYLDKAFDWAEEYGLKILIDLHTVAGSQNGYDNGGITGVCKWHKNPAEVQFALSVLERLAKRYAARKGLYGIEVLNEPISWLVWMTAPSTRRAEDKEEARGSGHVPMKFLKQFYLEAYQILRKYLPEEKVIVFHDGFRLGRWKDFFVKNQMKNVILDTHIYIFAMESYIPIRSMHIYRFFVWWNQKSIGRAAKYTPVVVGEWCIGNRLSIKKYNQMGKNWEIRKKIDRELADLQKAAWNVSAGWIYWSYQFNRDIQEPMEFEWMSEWDFRICKEKGWI